MAIFTVLAVKGRKNFLLTHLTETTDKAPLTPLPSFNVAFTALLSPCLLKKKKKKIHHSRGQGKRKKGTVPTYMNWMCCLSCLCQVPVLAWTIVAVVFIGKRKKMRHWNKLDSLRNKNMPSKYKSRRWNVWEKERLKGDEEKPLVHLWIHFYTVFVQW